MSARLRSIYRADAVQRYIKGNEKAVFPQWVSPRIFIFLWVLLGLLVVSGVVIWFARVPEYASGMAVVLDWHDQTRPISDVVVVAFLPSETLARLRQGQVMSLELNAAGERLRRPVVVIQPEVMSPSALQQQFALNPCKLFAINRPSAVAIARLGPTPDGMSVHAYTGGVYRVAIEVGSRRVISIMPLVGRFFGD